MKTARSTAAALLLSALALAGGYALASAQDGRQQNSNISQMIEEMRLENERLLERQKAMLKQIESIREDARQARIFSRRS